MIFRVTKNGFFLSITLFIFLSACQVSSNEDEKRVGDAKEAFDTVLLLSNNGLLTVFDTLQQEWLFAFNSKKRIKQIMKVDELVSVDDQVFADYLNDYIRNINRLNDYLLNSDDYEVLNTLSLVDSTKHHPSAKIFKEKIQKLGYTIVQPEGILQLERSTKYIGSEFQVLLSTPMKEFWKMYHLENEKAFAADAAIIQPLSDMVDRIIYWERFLKKYPDFAMKEHVNFEHDRYVYFLFAGMDNTPSFSYPDGVDLVKDFQKAYYYAVEQYPESDYAKKVNAYLDLLEANNHKRSPQINKFIEGFAF